MIIRDFAPYNIQELADNIGVARFGLGNISMNSTRITDE
jgi:hypothetical protein